MQISGKTVLITGGGSGIGLYLAKEFLRHNSKVIICGRNIAKLEKVQADESALEIAQCDVTNEAQITALLERCNQKFGGVDILVNNAGIFQTFDVSAGKFSLDHQIKEVDIDFNGPIRMVHYFLPDMLKKPESAIVNVSSGLAFIPFAAAPVYSATKAALHSWTLSLRKQLAGTSVRVFELMPPVVDTEMVSELDGFPKMPPEALAQAFMKGFTSGKLEITPGQSSQLKLMRRLAPNFIFNMVNRG